MRTVFKSQIMLVLIITGLLGSCKNNQDGYSDEIETSQTPIDSTKKNADTTQTGNNSGTGENGVQGSGTDGANSGAMSSGNNKSVETTAGTGIGPSADSTDGSTYTIESGLQKDSIKYKSKSKKSKK